MSLSPNPYQPASGTSRMTLGAQISAAPTSGRHPWDFAVYSGLKFLSVFLISSSPDIRGTAPPTPSEAASLFVLVFLLFCFARLTEIPIHVNIKTKPSGAATELAHFTLSVPPGAKGRQQQPHCRAGHQQGTLPGPPAHTLQIPSLAKLRGLEQIFMAWQRIC